ncbi:S1 domain-containing RNA-binding protein [Ligilactobacillus sp. Marseille-Q7487]|uniref:S1 domain-containing RNA-binding protein n=1 Tax=Ligilactobacillus sp. Marseille-Q7487 TaxID=3022128 RepID=UPI0024A8C9C8|nr:S1 domain-containing RNA-binding protein [Ligilactobacillus sp. Marseille-Q7487]
MSFEVGTKVVGKVSGITDFGAFVDLGDKKTGLVHISEVSDGFIKDINEVLNVGDEVTVRVLSIGGDGKIALSIRKASDKPKRENKQFERKGQSGQNVSAMPGKARLTTAKKPEVKKKDFDSLLAGFLKESDERLTSLKRNTEGKRGGRGGRRS